MKHEGLEERLRIRTNIFGGFPDFSDELVRVSASDGECWIWTGPLNTKGYGRVSSDDRAPSGRLRQVGAHRATFEFFVRPLSGSERLDHLCRRHACVRPSHLEPVSDAVNLHRGDTAASANARKTHCPRGHNYDDDNTYITKNGARDCRRCSAIDSAERRQKKEAA